MPVRSHRNVLVLEHAALSWPIERDNVVAAPREFGRHGEEFLDVTVKASKQHDGSTGLKLAESMGREREIPEWDGVGRVGSLERLAKKGQKAKARWLLACIALKHEKLCRAKVEAGNVATAFPLGLLP